MNIKAMRIICALLFGMTTIGLIGLAPAAPYAYWNFRGSIPISDSVGYRYMNNPTPFEVELPTEVPYRFLSRDYRLFIDGYITAYKDRTWGSPGYELGSFG